jgi:hypothetical protein
MSSYYIPEIDLFHGTYDNGGMKKKLGEYEWNEMAHKNASHLAKMHIETHNAAGIAEAFRDVEAVKALEFLFTQAEKYRKENKHAKAAVILEAASLIDRTSGEATDIILESTGSGKNEDTKLYIRRYLPEHVFREPIVYREIIEEA